MDGHDGGFDAADVDGGMGSHSGHDAYGNPDAGGAGHSSFEALSVGYSHEHGHHGYFSGFGIMAHGHHCGDRPGGASHSSHSHAGGSQRKPHSDRCDVAPVPPSYHGERRMFVAHVVAHSKVDIVGKLAQICRKYDTIRLDKFRPSMNGEDRLEYYLADDEPWLPPYDVENQPPAGWYPGATGTTRFVKQVWQVGKRPSLFDQGLVAGLRAIRKHDWVKDPEYDNEAKTYFDIGIVTWNYHETGDHDTLITIRIVSQLVWQRYFGQYGYKKVPFQKHQAAATKIIQELLEALKASTPNEEQVRLRKFYTSSRNVPAPKPEPKPPTTPVPPTTPAPPATPVPVDGCPPVPEGEVPGSGSDLGKVIAGSADSTPGVAPLQKVDVVVTIPK